MDEETKDLAFTLSHLRLEMDAVQPVILAAREAVSNQNSQQIDPTNPAIAALRAALALYDVARPKLPASEQPAAEAQTP